MQVIEFCNGHGDNKIHKFDFSLALNGLNLTSGEEKRTVCRALINAIV